MLDDAAYACGSVRDAFVERFRVRYAECDGHGHAVNAHYLTFCDPALDRMLCTRSGDFKAMGWEFMLVRSVIDRQASARMPTCSRSRVYAWAVLDSTCA